MSGNLLVAGQGAVWIKENPGPAVDYTFLQGHGAGPFTDPGETATPYYEASGAERKKFNELDVTTTPAGRATGQVDVYYKDVLQTLEQLLDPFHVQFRYDAGAPPSDPLKWDKIKLFLNCRKAQRQGSNQVARTPDNAGPIVTTFDFNAQKMVELLPVTVSRVTTSEVNALNAIAIDRKFNRVPKDGKLTKLGDVIYAGGDAAASASANLLKSTDAGATFSALASDPLATNDIIQAIAKIGSRLIVVDGTANLTIAYSDDESSWTTVTASGSRVLKSICAVDWSHIYLVSTSGYVYISRDGGATLEVLNAAAVTAQNLNVIKVLPSLTGFFVGASNAMGKTINGEDWTAVTGPNVGNALKSLEVINESTLFVGDDEAKLWMSQDAGASWTQVRFSGDGSGTIDAIEFARDADGVIDPEVGYFVHTDSGVSKIFRTVNGGKTWLYNQDGISTTPTNGGFNALAVVNENRAFAVGEIATTAWIAKVA